MKGTSIGSVTPEHWVETTIGQLCFTTSGGTPSRANKNYYNGSIPWIKSGELKDGIIIDAEEHISKDGINNSSSKLFPKDTILIALYGATIGKLGILGIEAATNQAICAIFRSQALDSKFLFFYLLSQRDNLVKAGFGAAQPNISQQTIRDYTIPLPPLNEQKRIVEKLDAILPKAKSAKTRLERIPGILKKFRQSVLAAACSGRLTEDWREARLDTPSATALDEQAMSASRVVEDRIEGSADLPVGWEEKLSGDIFSFVTSGSRGWARYYSSSGALFLRIGNLDHSSINLDLKKKQYVKPPKGSEGTRTRVQTNDILISITADVGMIGLIPNKFEEAYINQHISLARPINTVHPTYLAWYLASSEGQFQFKEMQRGATKVGLGLDDIKNVRTPIPPLSEQHEIVHRVEKLFTLADSLESKYKKAMARVEKIEQSVLAKAFRGELVEPDPNDEPAEELLKRILEEKAKLEGGKRKREK